MTEQLVLNATAALVELLIGEFYRLL